QCGNHYTSQSKQLVVIIDGLDHVWRERQSVEELDKLLGALLPLPTGVSLLLATQPIEDRQLPASLLRAAPRATWRELPLLGRGETREWLLHHVRDFDEVQGMPDEDPRIEALAATLFELSTGHPLHLRYTLRAVQERGLALREEVLRGLPQCPHDGI